MKSEAYPSTLYSSEQIHLREFDEVRQIFDSIRKKWLVLTPEEWVRQHLLLHLTQELGYGASSIAVEKMIPINGMPKRFDALIYVHAKPAILIECKAPQIPITEDVFHQACRYNTKIGAPMTLLSNGLQTVIAKVNFENGQVQFLREIPFRSDWDNDD